MTMAKIISPIHLAAGLLLGFAPVAEAHVVPWQAGESRMIGMGHCAKGACMKRASFASCKPHRHVNGTIVFDRNARPGK
jgi:hypothetical protein